MSSLKARLMRVDGGVELRSPGVGLWRDAPMCGSLVHAGARLGCLEVLGVLFELVAPEGAHGVVVATGGDEGRARRPVGYDTLLLSLDPDVGGVGVTGAPEPDGAGVAALVFRSPSSGRFYARPGPDRDPFVSEGDVVKAGEPVAMLEVMKTFNRIQYGGDELPAEARITRVVPADGDDLQAGSIILELERA